MIVIRADRLARNANAPGPPIAQSFRHWLRGGHAECMLNGRSSEQKA